MGDISMKRNGLKNRARTEGTELFWPVRARVCVLMIHTYHYSFSIIVKPLTSECCSFDCNYDVMRWQLR